MCKNKNLIEKLAIRFTALKYAGTPMRKAYRFADGKVQSSSLGTGFQGSFEVRTVGSMAELLASLDSFAGDEIAIAGVPKTGFLEGFVYTDKTGHPPLQPHEPDWYVDKYITRTQDDLCEVTNGLSVLFGDSDMDWAQKWMRDMAQTAQGMRDLLLRAIPELEGAAMGIRPSGSNGVCDPYGKPIKDSRNWHPLMLTYADERAAILQRLFDLAAVRGYGWLMIGENGAFHDRGPFDRALLTVNQPLFAALADVEAPMRYDRPAPLAIEGHVLRLHHLPEVDPDAVAAYYAALRTDPDILERQAAQKLRYREANIWRALELTPNPTPEQIQAATENELAQEAMRERALAGEPLEPDFVIQMYRGPAVTVAEILANRDQYHKTLTCDPLEPDYSGWKQTGILYLDGPKPKCVSLAHGQSTTYLLQTYDKDTRAQMEANLAAMLAPKDDEVSPEAGSVIVYDEISRFERDGGHCGLRVTMGAGKTQVALDVTYESDKQTLFLGPTTELCEEFGERYKGHDHAVWRGRGAALDGEPMCMNYPAVRHEIAKGNVDKLSRVICNKRECPFYDGCLYIEQRDRVGRGIKTGDVRVLMMTHDWFELPLPEGFYPERTFCDEYPREGPVNAEVWVKNDGIGTMLAMDPNCAPALLEAHMEEVKCNLITQRPTHMIEAEARTTEFLQGVIDGGKPHRVEDKLVLSRVRKFHRGMKNTMILDGTLNRDLWEACYGPFDRYTEVNVRLNAHYEHYSSALVDGKHKTGFGIVTMRNAKKVKEVAHLYERLGGAEDCVLITFKSVLTALRKEGLHVVGANFGGLRGLDHFKNYPNLLVVGDPLQPDAHTAMLAQTVAEARGLPVPDRMEHRAVEWESKTPDGAVIRGKYYVPEWDLQGWFVENYRKGEQIQGAFRTRPVHSVEKKKIVVVSNCEPFRQPDVVGLYESLLPTKAEATFIACMDRLGFVPVSKRNKVKYAGIEFRSLGAAERNGRSMTDFAAKNCTIKEVTMTDGAVIKCYLSDKPKKRLNPSA